MNIALCLVALGLFVSILYAYIESERDEAYKQGYQDGIDASFKCGKEDAK